MTEGVRQPGSADVSHAHSVRCAWTVFVLGTVFLLVLSTVFYPKAPVSIDEVRYMSAAHHLLTGKAFDRWSEAWFWKPRLDGETFERMFYSLSPAYSGLLTPFVAVDWRSVFLLGTLAHLGAFGGVVHVMRRRGLHPAWAVLYLLHPTAVLYSRMAMAELPSTALVVLVLVLLDRERPRAFLAGLVMGLTVLLKLSNVSVVAVFAVGCFVMSFVTDGGASVLRRLRRPLWMGLGMLPGIVALLWSNTYFFNSPLGNAYIGMEGGMFGWTFFSENFPFYAGALATVYPLMLVAPVFLRGRLRWQMRLSCVAALLFFGAYYYRDAGNSTVEELVRGLRFQLIVLPFYVLAYAEMIERLLIRLSWRRFMLPVLLTGLVLLAAGDIVMSREQCRHTLREYAAHERLTNALPGSGTLIVRTKYLNPVMNPGLRIITPRSGPDFVWGLKHGDFPALMVVNEGSLIRTEAYRDHADASTRYMLEMVERFYEVVPYDRPVEGFVIEELLRKREIRDKPRWTLLPFPGWRGEDP
ncbi:MAG TPA: hypothetical protein VMY39_05915 [Planctomycetota bacterium]|nr:hypothetical protein [Planctomycetota bacterium]